MIEESIRIKLNQFILAYERQSAELQFERQNIKQNVMLSIIQNRNGKKKLDQSRLSSKNSQNLASSKQTKLSQQKIKQNYYQNNNQSKITDRLTQNLQQQFNPFSQSSSKLLQKSNISTKSNVKANNILNVHDYEEQQSHQPYDPTAFANNMSTFGKSKIKNLQIQINQEQNNSLTNRINSKSSIMNPSSNKSIKISQENKNSSIPMKSNKSIKINEANQNERNNDQINKSINFKNSNLIKSQLRQKQLQDQYDAFSQSKSNMFAKNNSHQFDQNTNKTSLILNQTEQQQTFPTFQKPSFQFITNMSALRQSDPNYGRQQQEQRQPDETQQNRYVNQQTMGKWGSKEKQNNINYRQFQQQNHQQTEFNEDDNCQDNLQIQNIQQNQSHMIASQLGNKNLDQERKNYAFQINLEKSNLPSNQSIQQLKKKKILELEKKRQQRIQNNSRRKQNSSQISNQSKQQKGYSNVFVGNRNSNKRDNDNRDSLNKSINQKKGEKKNIKNSNYKNEQSVFEQNKTVLTKYGQQSKINNRSTSPLHTVKTIQTDKRPPLNKNKRQQNIFAPQSNTFQKQSTFQRQKSAHKIPTDPKIVPVDRKNSFQKKSNIKLMINALTYGCLPGELNRRERQRLIDILQKYQSQFCLFLFKQYSRKVIKGIYILQSAQQKLTKIFGEKAPAQIFPQQVYQFYRFDSGSRQFKKIDGCKTFSFSVHAIDLK